MGIIKEDKSVIYIIAGPNGAGKTTFARDFAKAKDLKFINADEIALKLNSNPNKVKIKAGKLFLNEIKGLIKTKQSFIIETTLSGNYLKKIIKNVLILNEYVYNKFLGVIENERT